MSEQRTPITDALEAKIEAEGKRDVPVRVYQQLRAFERDRDELIAALRDVLDSMGAIDRPWELEGHGIEPRRAEQICALLAKDAPKAPA